MFEIVVNMLRNVYKESSAAHDQDKSSWIGYVKTVVCLFGSLHPSQQLWSCQDSQFTIPHFFPGHA